MSSTGKTLGKKGIATHPAKRNHGRTCNKAKEDRRGPNGKYLINSVNKILKLAGFVKPSGRHTKKEKEYALEVGKVA